MPHPLLSLLVISICYSYTPTETEPNVSNVAPQDELLKTMTEMSNEIKQLKLQQNEFIQIRKELLLTQRELQSLKDEQWMTKHVLGVKRSPVVPKVAFTASISRTLLVYPDQGQTLVFDNVHLNIGDGYNKHSGVFRAPVAGLYIVMVTIATDFSTGPDVAVVHNGSRVCVTIPSMVDHSYAGSPCNVIVQLRQGDEVWAQVYSGRPTDTVRDGMWSTFSVALLSMDESASS